MSGDVFVSCRRKLGDDDDDDEHGRTSGMEDSRPEPGIHARNTPRPQIALHNMPIPHLPLNPLPPYPMHPKVHNRKKHRRGLLHPHPPPKRPLPIILLDRFPLSDGLIGDEVHAGVRAVVLTRPARQAEGQWQVMGRAWLLRADVEALLERQRAVSC